jgi:hypothetical protein
MRNSDNGSGIIWNHFAVLCHAPQMQVNGLACTSESVFDGFTLTEATGKGRNQYPVSGSLGFGNKNYRVLPHGPYLLRGVGPYRSSRSSSEVRLD